MSAAGRETALIAKLAATWPVENWRDVTVLVAVSGGADSVALARGLSQLRVAGEGRLLLAHYNHGLRGAESDADQAFVEEMARELGAAIILGSPSSPAPSSEDSLRQSRYEFLSQAANQCGARYVATAHTADDQVETVLFNILRGTGLAGLSGIPRMRPLTEAATLIRPLLDVTRADVLEYLLQIDKPWREDSTNAGTSYSRNRIRNELLPLLARDYNPQVRDALARLSQIASEADELVDAKVRRLLSRTRRLFGEDVEIQTARLSRVSDLVARAALHLVWQWQGWPLSDMCFKQWTELLELIRAKDPPHGVQVAPRTFPGGVRAERRAGVLKLTRPN